MASPLFRRPAARWAVPGVVTAVVVGSAIAVPVIASTDDELPERGPIEVLASLEGADEVPFAGTVVQTSELGLPPLPDGLLSADDRHEVGTGATISDLLTGSNTARVWYGGPDQVRVALQDETEQSDLIVDGDDVWLWNSADNAAVHTTRDALSDVEPHRSPMATPPAAAGLALGALGEDSDIHVDGTAQVAGRAAYELVVEPKDEQSLIGSIRLAVDGEHGVPLRVQVFDAEAGADDDAAIEIGFTSVTFDDPDDSVFAFAPPSGATVEEVDPDAVEHKEHGPEDVARFAPTVVGDGWSSVLVLRGVDPATMADDAMREGADDEVVAEGSAAVDAFLASLPQVEGPYGSGVLFESDLVSALLLDDGRLLIGAVTPEALEDAATQPEAAVDAG